jgi:hypothetical protein
LHPFCLTRPSPEKNRRAEPYNLVNLATDILDLSLTTRENWEAIMVPTTLYCCLYLCHVHVMLVAFT